MEGRRDALVGAAELIVKCREIGVRPNGRSTVGVIESESRNTIPGCVFTTIDFRHPDDRELTKMTPKCALPPPTSPSVIGLR